MPNNKFDSFSIGTEFQKLVWRELVEIPNGETRSYKEIDEKIGRLSLIHI